VKNSAMPLFLWPWFCIVSSTMALMESRELQNDAMKESTFWSWILASLSHINRGDSIWVRTVSVAFLCILFGWGYDFSKRSFWFSKFFFFFFAFLVYFFAFSRTEREGAISLMIVLVLWAPGLSRNWRWIKL